MMYIDPRRDRLRTGGARRAYQEHELTGSKSLSRRRGTNGEHSGAGQDIDRVLQPRTVTADADGSACGSGALLQSHRVATCSMLTRL